MWKRSASQPESDSLVSEDEDEEDDEEESEEELLALSRDGWVWVSDAVFSAGENKKKGSESLINILHPSQRLPGESRTEDLRLVFGGFFPELSCPLTSISLLSSSSCFSRASSSRDLPALFLLAVIQTDEQRKQ